MQTKTYISITKKSDTTYVYHSDLSRYDSHCTVANWTSWLGFYTSLTLIVIASGLSGLTLISNPDFSINIV